MILKDLIDEKKLSIAEFERKIGVKSPTISKIIDRNSKISQEILYKCIIAFPELNPMWLLSGKGDMYKSDLVGQNSAKKQNIIPLIPIEAMAGFGSGEIQVNQSDITEGYVIPEFEDKKVQYIIRVSGSSMYPKYSNGDLLGCVPVTDMSFFQWGKAYVLDTTQGAMVKRLFPVENNNELLECRSDNSEKYPPFQIPKSSVYRISIVVGVIRME